MKSAESATHNDEDPTAAVPSLLALDSHTENTVPSFREERKFLLYKEQQAQLVSRVAGVDVDLAGDGRCDSPGHSAKYGTYALHCSQVSSIQVHEDLQPSPKTRLAVLHFNENATRDQAQNQNGQGLWKRRLSKSRKGHFTARKVMEAPTFGYVAKLMADVVERAGASSHKTSSMEISSETRSYMTDKYEAPSMQELIATHRCRFPG
ncbi:hypothetical protein HPB52_007079 [Rhipicephalus sanguineus]|uniref:Uncharacterized protein n=1 Tax=Rhipicephalus sanguineus TaxID=34632 RepID=A0A9D4PEA2_RHISA|nr:hypothetical protein HPB52_007079 [Rhipicephalus sanguineus]